MNWMSQWAMAMSLALIMTAPCLAQDDHCYQRTHSIRTDDKFFVTTNDKRSELEHNLAGAGKVQTIQFKYTVVRQTSAKSLHINLGYLFKGPEGPRRATLAIADAKAGTLVF